MAETEKRCPKCGAVIPDGFSYCPECAVLHDETSKGIAMDNRAAKLRNRIILITLAVVALALLLILPRIASRSGSTVPKYEGVAVLTATDRESTEETTATEETAEPVESTETATETATEEQPVAVTQNPDNDRARRKQAEIAAENTRYQGAVEEINKKYNPTSVNLQSEHDELMRQVAALAEEIEDLEDKVKQEQDESEKQRLEDQINSKKTTSDALLYDASRIENAMSDLKGELEKAEATHQANLKAIDAKYA